MDISRIVALGNDHVAYDLKFALMKDLEEMGYAVINFGCDTSDTVDYPHYAKAVAEAITESRAGWGVLVCGSGLGISIAANRFPKIRAAPASTAAPPESVLAPVYATSRRS